MNTKYHRFSNLHWPMICVVMAILGMGIYNLHSAAAARESTLHITQLYWGLAGFTAILGVLAFDYRLTENFAYVFYAIVCLLLLAVLVQGKTAGGAQRWLVLGPMTFQPSEIAKIATVFVMARYFSYRLGDGAYSMRELFRPLNPSRPLAVVILLALGWSNRWVVDPIGELARTVRLKLPELEPLSDLLWVRIAMLTVMVGGCAASIYLVHREEARAALLNPWRPGRKKKMIMGAIAATLALVAVLVMGWNHPLLRDPFGVLIASLHAGAAAGGLYAELNPSLTLRLLLGVLSAVYALVAVLALRRFDGQAVDLAIAPVDLLALPALLVLVEPDLGTAGIIILIGFTMIMVVGIRRRSLLILGVQGAVFAGLAWFGVLKDYQKRRILTFIDPEHDIKGAGWNAIQSMIAVGSGRWWGKGHMEGTQSQLSFLPEQHTDFAFSVWGEEQGFMGCALVLVLYFLLIAFAFIIAANAREAYGALLATGFGALILWHTIINIGMVIGVMPVVGLTLPMFSYGGTSMLTVMLAVGLILNVHWRRRAY